MTVGPAPDGPGRTDAEQALTRERARLQLLLEGSEAANRSATLVEATRSVLEIVSRHTPWVLGQLFLVRDGRPVFSGLVAPADADERGLAGAPGEPLSVLQAVVDAGRPRRLPCSALGRGTVAAARGFVMWQGLPIVAGGSVRAVVELFSRGPGEGDATEQVLEQLSRQLGNVHERELLAEAHAQSHRELEQVNRELRDFAAAASHELQEPLRKISAFGDRLERQAGPLLEGEAADSLARMRAAATRMSALIEALAHLTRISTRPLALRPVALAATVAEVLAEMDGALAAAGAEVVVGDLPDVVGEPIQLRQLFLNLVGNAVKYRSRERPLVVHVDGERTTAGVRVTVSDNGIGFEPQHAERIFRPFQRLHGRSEYPGTGMGLALVRRIVERHGGGVTASGETGRGAVFELTFPATGPLGEASP